MRDHEGDIRGFYWWAKSRHAHQDKTPRIGFGLYCPDGGTSGEMQVEWFDLHHGARPQSPQLQVYDDGWSAFATFTDLLQMMAEADGSGKPVTQERFVGMLLACGFKDMTPYAEPAP